MRIFSTTGRSRSLSDLTRRGDLQGCFEILNGIQRANLDCRARNLHKNWAGCCFLVKVRQAPRMVTMILRSPPEFGQCSRSERRAGKLPITGAGLWPLN